ncbi:HlyD family secretion protein [Pseudomonas sivasensis]|uniref:efflux RND transporter periplasmic adaptor subunit n=1 Tax=Pseudomonas TaxID=286 RepID=UPI0021AA273D|nr:HlyD family secretion protein [Pseudomonas sivasensis]MCT4496861.1 HlyD family secretion protein [Pseudomonas sivasensis]
MNSTIRICVTLLIASCAVLTGSWTWNHYRLSPWTRDGRVRADVVVVAPDVAGWVSKLEVRDNQAVKKGDLLFEIDPARYRSLLNESKARMEHAKHAWELAALLERRRVPLASINAISAEDLDNAPSQVLLAESQYEVNKAQWETARINLSRTSVTAPADGTITNVRLQEGNYVAQGTPALSLIKEDSFYVTAYFEETKLLDIREGDLADVSFMTGGPPITGHVLSIAKGVANTNTLADPMLLPQVQQAFNWVRLAQRIPVDIKLDANTANTRLIAGMNASVRIHERGAEIGHP